MKEPEHHDERDDSQPLSRRDMLKTTAAALGGAAAASPGTASANVEYQPEEVWRDRMTAPDDGKRFGWIVDTRRCFGCHACEVACKAENDVPLGNFIRQTIYHDFKQQDQVARIMVPMACQHCEDAPCIKACPCGALHKGAGGSVQVNYDTCSGHAACVDACPYGAIYIDPVANQAIKCHNCTHRLEADMAPACESTCPSDALIFGDLNDPDSRISKMRSKLEGDLETLRPEAGTKPRMEFVVDEKRPMEEWENKVPGPGKSYSPDAYNIYNWGSEGEAKS